MFDSRRPGLKVCETARIGVSLEPAPLVLTRALFSRSRPYRPIRGSMSASLMKARAAGALNSVALARQPILDRRESVVGYELRYQPVTWPGQLADPETSIARTMVAGLADIGLRQLVADRLAHVKVTRQFLLYVGQLPLPPQHVVLELVGPHIADPPLVRVLCALVEEGIQIALVGFVPSSGGEALLDLAAAVKLEAGALLRAGPAASDLLTAPRAHGARLIADRVETREEYEVARELGFDAFQGDFFASPASIRGSAPPTHRLGALISLTRGASGWSFEDLERHISEDAGLSYRFLRLANSAFFGARSPVGSIREGLTRLGAVAVRRWIMLLALSGIADRPQHLLNTALQRARLCELLAREYTSTIPDQAFTAGLFSILDVLLGRPMDELLSDLPLEQRLVTAITEHRGPEGRLLAAVLAYERGDFQACTQQGIRLLTIANAYRDALHWADDTTVLLA